MQPQRTRVKRKVHKRQSEIIKLVSSPICMSVSFACVRNKKARMWRGDSAPRGMVGCARNARCLECDWNPHCPLIWWIGGWLQGMAVGDGERVMAYRVLQWSQKGVPLLGPLNTAQINPRVSLWVSLNVKFVVEPMLHHDFALFESLFCHSHNDGCMAVRVIMDPYRVLSESHGIEWFDDGELSWR